ncbi:hypothetical protein EDB85DRAFT_1893552 [Lactarius pseudohatsudake]|nr:hypothetical protein EDB85DRAFT_1893552 [Lactarius pseudohatsudake]
MEVAPHTTPGPCDATVKMFDPSTPACNTRIVPWSQPPLLTISHMQRHSRRVHPQVHPDTSISNKTTAILNSFVNDIFERRFIPPTLVTIAHSHALVPSLLSPSRVTCDAT